LNIDSLNQFFSQPNIPNDVEVGPFSSWTPLVPPLQISQFKFGQSNPTFLLTDSNGKKAVLRKKPTANKNLISKTAHAIEREFYMLASIQKVNSKAPTEKKVPIAEVYLLCQDESHIGAVFYVMEFIKGRIFHDASLSVVESSAERELIWKSVVKTAASIHSIPSNDLFDQLPTSFFKKPKPTTGTSPSYFERQIKSMSRIHELQSKDAGPIPYFDKTSSWLLKNSPKDPKLPTLIHGDFKIDNLVFHPTEPKVIAVLDWELCTNGHPLFDLSNVLQPFVMSAELNGYFSKFPIEADPDLVDKVLSSYIETQHPDWDPKELWKVGVVFGLYRVGVICQGIKQRVVKGVASSAEAKTTAEMFPLVGRFSYSVITGGDYSKL
jgi:aminoglycoside phosphotransferase (APT) family kinase protein